MRHRTRTPSIIFAGIALLVGGCCSTKATLPASAAWTAGDTPMVRTELYFGLSKDGGGEITPAQFGDFVADVITPRFPDGLTIVDGIGQWRDASGKIEHERSKILIVLHKTGDETAKSIEEIRSQYKTRFGEESVMRVTSEAGVAF